jgi:1-acyl-sn-glycerol-3-phosphate acyltransferase
MLRKQQEQSMVARPNTVGHTIAFTVCARLAKLALIPIARLSIPELVPLPDQKQGFIVAANHRSMLDIFVAIQAFHKWQIYPHVFIRGDYFRLPVVGRLLHLLGALPAGRGESAIDLAKELLRSGGILAIAPEGRIPKPTERIGQVARFKAGVGHLASPDATPILLLAILNTDACWQLGRKFPRIHLLPAKRPYVQFSTAWLAVQPGQRGLIITKNVREGLSRILEELEENDASRNHS